MKLTPGKVLRAVRRPGWALDRILFHSLSTERYAGWRFGSARSCVRQLRRVVAEDRRPVVVFPPPSVAWGYLFQRPQQLAIALAREGCCVLYAADPTFAGEPDGQVRGVMRLESGPVLFADGRGGRMIAGLDRPVICVQYWPHQSGFRRYLPAGSTLVYDCLDDLGVFEPYAAMREDHERTLAEADLITVSSKSLLASIGARYPGALLLPNAAAYEDFANPPGRPWEELRRLRERSRTIVGYFGALGKWVDWGLLEHVAQARPGWTLLLVGDVMSEGLPLERLRRHGNVHIWPRQPYARLPDLLAAFDVAIVPFAVSELTAAVSPIKLFEYMAGGKPVVSTALPECEQFPVVRIGASREAFVEGIEWSLGEGSRMEHRERLREVAREHTWGARARALLEALSRGSGS